MEEKINFQVSKEDAKTLAIPSERSSVTISCELDDSLLGEYCLEINGSKVSVDKYNVKKTVEKITKEHDTIIVYNYVDFPLDAQYSMIMYLEWKYEKVKHLIFIYEKKNQLVRRNTALENRLSHV